MSLLDSTRKLLTEHQSRGGSLREIAGSSGGAVEREWLYRFARGEIENPGVKHVQALHDYLAKPRKKAS